MYGEDFAVSVQVEVSLTWLPASPIRSHPFDNDSAYTGSQFFSVVFPLDVAPTTGSIPVSDGYCSNAGALGS